MRDFHKPLIWQSSHQLTLDVYNVSKLFPKDELFGLTSQIRRAASSIPTNMAKGCECENNKSFAHFFQIAIESASETEYQLLLVCDLKYITNEQYKHLFKRNDCVRKMFIKYQSELKS